MGKGCRFHFFIAPLPLSPLDHISSSNRWIQALYTQSIANTTSSMSLSTPLPKRRRTKEVGRAEGFKTDEAGYNLNSVWKEPPRADDLTLYDVNRLPRPTLPTRTTDDNGEETRVMIQRPLRAIRSEFRCVICLDFIRNTRIVMECLHRFCEGMLVWVVGFYPLMIYQALELSLQVPFSS